MRQGCPLSPLFNIVLEVLTTAIRKEKEIKGIQFGKEEKYLNIIKAICVEKPTANIMLNGEILKAFPSRSGTRQGCPLFPIVINTVVEVLIRKRNTGHQNWKRRSKIISADDIIFHVENPKDSTTQNQNGQS